MACALKILSRMLDMHYEAPSVVLIDDYDVPLQQACLHHYCQDLKKHYVRSFSIGLQGNTHMHYGILTGVLWVKMGNMLTGGFDHLLPDTVLDEEFGTSFGFTGEEVRDLARLCGEEGRYPELREWYGGHCIGGTEIFNPQSVMKYFASGCQARPYWTDAVDTGMLTELLERTSGDTEKRLIRIQNWKPGHEPVQGYFYFNLGMNLTEDRKYVRTDLFSFLIAEGLLRADNVQYGRGLCVPADLAVPNRETQEPFHKEVISRLAQRNLSSSVGVLEG